MRATDWSAKDYARNARFVADLGAPLLELLAPRSNERILDLGCGDGALTAKIAATGCSVLGVDSSEDMIAAARGLGLDARVIDAQVLEFHEEFDAVFSNAALHWMKRPAAVIDGVWKALKAGGRFVAEMGGAGNIATITAALEAVLLERGLQPESPWFFPSANDYGALLESRGFKVNAISLFNRPTPLPGAMADWLETFAHAFIGLVPPAERAAYVSEVEERLVPRLRDTHGRWTADYVRLRFVAYKPD
jgi:trans-aconitate methyltransferase